MNTIAASQVVSSEPIEEEPPITAEELRCLRRLLSVVRVDAASETLRLETGSAKILLRPDGTVRIEGRQVTQLAQGSLKLNGAVIELN